MTPPTRIDTIDDRTIYVDLPPAVVHQRIAEATGPRGTGRVRLDHARSIDASLIATVIGPEDRDEGWEPLSAPSGMGPHGGHPQKVYGIGDLAGIAPGPADMTPERACQGCGAALARRATPGNERKFCGDACRAWARRHEGGELRPVNCACVECGVPIVNRAVSARRCLSCAPPKPAPAIPRDATCVVCACAFTRTRADRTYCSRRCARKAQRRRYRTRKSRARTITNDARLGAGDRSTRS